VSEAGIASAGGSSSGKKSEDCGSEFHSSWCRRGAVASSVLPTSIDLVSGAFLGGAYI
jgi:hypothetical protein